MTRHPHHLQDEPAQIDAGFVLACLAVFLSPMNNLRVPGIYFTATDGVAVIALSIMLVSGQLPRRPFEACTSIWMSGFLLLGAGLMLGSLAHGSAVDLVTILLQYSVSLIALPLLLAGRSRPQVLILLRLLMYSITFVMLFGIWLIHFVPHPPIQFVTRSGRLQSLVERENECAALGAIAVILLVYFWQNGRVRMIEMLIVLPALLYGIMLTGSNTGILVLGAGVILLIVMTGSVRSLAMLVVAGMAVTFLINFNDGILLPEVFRNRVLNGAVSGDLSQSGTFSDRVILIQEAFQLASDYLVVGMGADQYRHVSSFNLPVHNTYLLLLCEGGIMALTGVVLLLLTGIPAAIAALGRSPTRSDGALTLTILLIYALVLNTFPHFYARFWNVPLILALALSCASARVTVRPLVPSFSKVMHV